MSSISDALQRLNLLAEQISRSQLAYPINARDQFHRLTQLARDFASQAKTVRVPKPPLDAKEVWRYWAGRNYQLHALDCRQIRTLCVSPDTAVAPELVNALHANAEPLNRTTCLLGLVFAYFAKWGAIRYQDRLEDLLRKGLATYKGRNPLLGDYRHNSATLFQARVPEALAGLCLEAKESPLSVLNRLHIARTSSLTAAVLQAAAQSQALRLQSARSESVATKELEYALEKVLIPDLPRQAFCAAVSAAILCDWAGRSTAFQTTLRTYVLDHNDLGDPRLKQANWVGMEKAASERFLAWLAKDSIVFFFHHVLPDSDLNRRRKDFWLRYAGRIKDFQVALSEYDYRRLVTTARLKDVPGFARLNHPTTSAFLMRFGVPSGKDIMIVEFSETGNAAHMFDAVGFCVRSGNLRSKSFEFSRLKHAADDNRIVHRGERWEYSAFQRMAEWGVRL